MGFIIEAMRSVA